MEPGFWHERWQKGEIGFHLSEVNPRLRAFWPRLGVSPHATVFVPLCGKSLDMIWLREQGHRVVGVELSPIAVTQFFAEQGATPTVTPRDGFACHECDDIALWCGDFFALEPQSVWGEGTAERAIYDRAALVALPEAMRPRYAERLLTLARWGQENAASEASAVPMLLVTLEYPQAQRNGPPFSVPPSEVTQLFASAKRLEHWLDEDVLPQHPHWVARGVRYMREHVFALWL